MAIILATLVAATPTHVASSSYPAINSCDHTPSAFRCVTVIKAADGDTITVDIPNVPSLFGKGIRVRIAGIDAPELHFADACETKAAESARDFVRKVLADGKRVDLVNVKRDKYFRILADVQVDGQSLRNALLDARFAYPYDGKKKTKRDWCPVQTIAPEAYPAS